MNNSTPNNDFDIDLIDFDFDFSDEKLDSKANTNEIRTEDEVIDLRETGINKPKNISSESKDTFDIGNLNTNNYNIENIDTKKTSEYNKTNEEKYNFDRFGNKKTLSKIEYINNTNISDEKQTKGMSNNNTLNKFYELEIDDYPNRTDLLHLDDINNKSLGLNTKTSLLDKLFGVNKNNKRRM